mmetsp:Transcript_19983/g.59763  ORF Transcript_19983/g.59763 Transcript_19983/m.59763 type:complete len:395 (+) Transcript_19983:63-1247(+)
MMAPRRPGGGAAAASARPRWAMTAAGAALTMLLVGVLLYRGTARPKFIAVDWEHDDGPALPTAKGLMWLSLLPPEIRALPQVVQYLEWKLTDGTDTLPIPPKLFAAYVDAVLPTGLVVLRTMSAQLSEVALLRHQLAATAARPPPPGSPPPPPFCLITADGVNDMPVTAGDGSVATLEGLTAWYSTNLVNTAAMGGLPGSARRKIRPIPLLLDLHTSLRGGLLNTPLYRTQRAKYAAMEAIRRRSAVPPEKRVMAALLGHMSLTDPSRADAFAVGANPGVVRVSKVSTSTLWAQWFSTHAFGISPRGRGVDCHRTWEMLFFGMIPIVPSSALDPLYHGLPVVIVKTYREVTPANLELWWGEHRENVRNVSRYFDPHYWIDSSVCPPPRRPRGRR